MKVNLILNNLSDLAAFAEEAKLQQKPRGGLLLTGSINGLEISCSRKELIKCAQSFFDEAQGCMFAKTGGDYYSYSLICVKMRHLSSENGMKQSLLTKIHRVFGNLFYSWNKEMSRTEMKLFSQQLLYSAPRDNEASEKAKERLVEAIKRAANEVPTLDNIHAFLEVGDNLGSSHPEIRESLADYLKNCGVIDDLLAQAYFFACKGGWGWTLEEMKEMGLQKVYESLVLKEHNLSDEPMRKQWIVKAIECTQRFKFLINSAGSELS